MSNMYVLVNRSQLDNDVNTKASFQKMRIPFYMIYLKFLCGRHIIQGLVVLPDFAEVCIKFPSFLQSSLLTE